MLTDHQNEYQDIYKYELANEDQVMISKWTICDFRRGTGWWSSNGDHREGASSASFSPV